MFGSLIKAVVGLVVETPLAIVKDVVTMGGAITEKDEPYSVTALKKFQTIFRMQLIKESLQGS